MAKVLIVDDEKSIRRTLGEFLREAGYEVAEADDADSALAQLRAAAFDVVVTDIVLPRVTGVELLGLISAAAPDVQVVMMTGEPTVETATEALRLGAVDYLFKPITKAAILRVVTNAARIKLLEDTRRRLEAENQAHRENLERTVVQRTGQLQESEARFRALVETTFDWLWEVDAETRYTYVSPKVRELLGYTPEEVLGRTPFDLMPETEAQRVGTLFREIAARRDSFSALENINQHKDGRVVVLETSGVPVRSPDGEFKGYRGMDRDITERKRADVALRQSEAEFRAMFELASIGMAQADVQTGQFQRVNRKLCEITGYSEAELLQMRVSEINHAEDRMQDWDFFQRVVRGEMPDYRVEKRYLRKDNSVAWVNVNMTVIRDAAGQPVRTMATIEDITERRRLDEELRSSLAEQTTLLKEVHHRVKNNLQVVISLLNLQARHLKHPAALTAMRDTQARIRSMALLHEALHRQGTAARVNAAVYLPHLCASLSQAYLPQGGRIKLHHHILPIELNLDQATPCGLIVNELVSNAFKHAFPNDRSGQITVSMSPAGQGQVLLTVADDGQGLPADHESNESTSLGMNLVGQLARQIGATLEFKSAPGTIVELHFPYDGPL